MDSCLLSTFRFDPLTDKEPHYSTFRVPVQEGTTLLEALLWVVDNLDGSLSFRYACREAICGGCALFVNGQYRLACNTQVRDLQADEIVVGPLPHLPVIKDLVVDMKEFWRKLSTIRPYLIAEGLEDREFYQSHRDRQSLEAALNCVLCACCYSACPTVWTRGEYAGPLAWLQSNRFVSDTRDNGGVERLKLVAGNDGIWRCETSLTCAESCPKQIDIAQSVKELKDRLTVARPSDH